ncbi:hypothetical protein MC885_013273 [Smutsia gigantea]|nr:hypothetical protein MC885_013273 [Smutsia gigantea]
MYSHSRLTGQRVWGFLRRKGGPDSGGLVSGPGLAGAAETRETRGAGGNCPSRVLIGDRRCSVSTCQGQVERGAHAPAELSWDSRGRQVKPAVSSHPEQFSLIHSQHPFIVPGGRFVEFYYWDSYWVMEGLLLSEMTGTVKGMLQNFLDLVKNYGHVPNGARVYYLQRSQPPLLTLMMERYVAHTNDTAFLRDNIGTLASELDFWTVNRSVSVSLERESYV